MGRRARPSRKGGQAAALSLLRSCAGPHGFWALAARTLGEEESADALCEAVVAANRLEEGSFAEYLDACTGKPGGARGQAWSTAGEVLATRAALDLLVQAE